MFCCLGNVGVDSIEGNENSAYNIYIYGYDYVCLHSRVTHSASVSLGTETGHRALSQ